MTTIQDVEARADELATALRTFDASDQKAKADRGVADAAGGLAAASENAAAVNKAQIVSAHTAFDAALDSFLVPVPEPTPAPVPAPPVPLVV
jgi:hypothetical protein